MDIYTSLSDEDMCIKSLDTTTLSHSNIFILNVFLHVTILFTFLNILFKIIIAPLAVDAFKNEISTNIRTIIDKSIPTPIILPNPKDNNINLNDTPLSPYVKSNNSAKNIQQLLNILQNNKIYDNYITEYSNPNPLLVSHNDDIIANGYYLSIILIIISIILITVIKRSCSECINVTKLVIENLLTFICVGIVEFWFFTTYAKNFVPTSPSLIVSSAIDNIKSYLIITPSS
jgi:hypothetical protein